MLKQQVYHSHSYGKPLFSWRGMQTWCLGRRASGLCRFFVRMRSRPRLRIASIILPCAKFRQPRKPQAFFLKWLSHTKQQRSTKLACCLPIIKGENGGAHCQDPIDVQDQSQKPFQRHHMHAQTQVPFKRVDGTHAKTQQDHVFSTQLGSSDSSIMSCLQRQGSSGEISFNSQSTLSLSSSASSSSSSIASGSFHRVSGSKLRETCAKVVHGGPSICELVAGNQFLVHLSAAPIVAAAPANGGLGTGGSSTGKDKKSGLNPSMGLVANSSLRHKDADINDRIVFFK
eukprot:c26913_g1_i1 orf=360-1217(+)